MIAALILACTPPYVDPAIVPAEGSTGVPLNAEIRFDVSSMPGGFRLFDADGGRVPLTFQQRALTFLAARPDQLLLPKTRYTFEVGDTPRIVTSSFTTGTASDVQRPASPGRAFADYVEKGLAIGCGMDSGGYFWFIWRGASDAETPASGLMVEAQIDGEMIFAHCSDDGTCRARWRPGMQASATIQAQAVDWAGNGSVFTDPEPIQGCGCSSGPSALVLLALVLIRKRECQSRSLEREWLSGTAKWRGTSAV